MQPGYVGLYWGARSETNSSCAKAIAEFLSDLGRSNSHLESWFRKVRRRNQPLVSIPLNSDGIQAELKTERRDSDKSIIAELGFSFSAWNGDDTGILCRMGCTNPRVQNAIVVGFDNGLSEELSHIVVAAGRVHFRPDSTRVELGGK